MFSLHDPILRPALFGVFLVLFIIWESLQPKRDRTFARLARWTGNLGLIVVGSVVVRLILPIAPVGAALWAHQNGVGVFNTVPMPVPMWVAGALSFLLLDLLIYGQHRLFHKVPLLWRLHRMHHTDIDLDVTSGLRFHPLEILLSLIIKVIAVVILGAPALAVLVFEIVLNATSMFNHANLALPQRLDSVLRRIVVTPDMHRVHHSIDSSETDSNFGFNLPWWDRLFGTYVEQPAAGHAAMTLGLPIFRDIKSVGLWNLLVQPFVEDSPELKTGSDSKEGGNETSPPS
ncbi:MAG: sterol desaturase family protein [Rhodospirillaceae bacterium]